MLMLQGGARLQFSMIPMNLMGGGRRLVRLHRHRLVEQVRGPGSREVRRDAHRLGRQADELRSPAGDRPICELDPKAAYVYYASNETIQGVQFPDRAGRRQRAAGVRRVERFPEPAGRHAEVRHLLRLCAKERRARPG